MGVWGQGRLADNARVSEGTAAGGGPGDPGVVSSLDLCMEVAGCPTVCRHCWAQGVGYGAMPLADIEWVLAEAHRFCDGAGLAFDTYPMHEMAAHPDAARLFALFNAHGVPACGRTMFEPLTTTGVPLAVREDWREVLRAAADTGTVNLWVALHGVGEVHDRQVNRGGAYAETCLAIRRARSAGLSVGGNIFLTTASLAQLDELTAVRRRLPVNAALVFTVAGFLPTPRSRRNEQLRLALPDLLPHAARMAELTAPAQPRLVGQPRGVHRSRVCAPGPGRRLASRAFCRCRTPGWRARLGVPPRSERVLRPGGPVPDPAWQRAGRQRRRGAWPRPRPRPARRRRLVVRRP